MIIIYKIFNIYYYFSNEIIIIYYFIVYYFMLFADIFMRYFGLQSLFL